MSERAPRDLSAAIALASLLCACGGAAPPPSSAADVDEAEAPPEPERWAIALRLQDGGTDDSETPHTQVSLVRISPDGERSVIELHDEVGACYPQPARGGALIATRCWWAGQGALWSVRREGDAVVAYRAVEPEEGAPPEPSEAGRLEVPEDAELDLVQ